MVNKKWKNVLPDSVKLMVDEHLIALGREATTFFDARNYQFFDPLVGDGACHLRAMWLMLFLRRHPKIVKFPENNLKILGLFIFLSNAKSNSYWFDSDIIQMQKTNTNYLPDGWNNFIKNILNARMQLYVYLKQEIIKCVNSFFRDYILSEPLRYKQNLLEYFNDDVCTKYDNGFLPILATVPSFVAVLEMGIAEKLPIVMLLFQIVISDEVKCINDIELFFLKPSRDKYCYNYDDSDTLVKADEPVLIFEIGHFVAKDTHSMADLFKFTVKHVRDQDPHEFILQCIALHYTYPTGENCYIKKDDKFILMNKSNEPVYSLNELYSLTKKLKEELKRPEICLTKLRKFEELDVYNIQHVYVGTVNDAVKRKLKIKSVEI